MSAESALAVLQGLPVLGCLPPDVRDLVVASFVPEEYGFGRVLVQEGEPADALYVLASGKVRVVKRAENGDDMSLGTLRPGDTFGEAGFLEPGGVHPTTVRTSSDVEVLRLDRAVFEDLLQRRPEVREFFQLQTRHRNLEYFLRQFAELQALPPEALGALLRRLEPVTVKKGETVFAENDPPGPLYIVEEGRFRAHIGLGARRRNVGFHRRGEFFGDRSVFRGEKRECTVEAVTDGVLLALTPDGFAELTAEHPEFEQALEERMAQYDFRHTAQIPIDLFQELLPADAGAQASVGTEQVDQDLTQTWAVPVMPRPAATPAASAAPDLSGNG
ncbi:MAG TPA: cyclic nucleotide-binding domain-containing protein, partial [Gemmatimonadales bacterium]|nr:cyclic nucleotide-binding domain-containing protein [Gemmatimonadales bacterium]